MFALKPLKNCCANFSINFMISFSLHFTHQCWLGLGLRKLLSYFNFFAALVCLLPPIADILIKINMKYFRVTTVWNVRMSGVICACLGDATSESVLVCLGLDLLHDLGQVSLDQNGLASQNSFMRN